MDLTAIDPLKLPSLPLEKKADLPDCPAIYFAISGSGEILYIGRTADLGRARTSPKNPSEKIVYVQGIRTVLLSESARTARIRQISVLDSPKWY